MNRSIAKHVGIVLCAAFQGCATYQQPVKVVEVKTCDKVCEAATLMGTLAQSRRADGQPDRGIMAAGLATYLTARPDLKSAIRQVLLGQDVTVTETGEQACAWTKAADGKMIAECASLRKAPVSAP